MGGPGILTFKDNLNACAEIASCCDLKLVADADTGYGNAVNVHFTVKALKGQVSIVFPSRTKFFQKDVATCLARD